MDAADVLVADAAGEADLGAHAVGEGRVCGDAGGEELDGDGLAQLEVVGAVDLAHSAAAEEGDDAVALGDGVARGEALLGLLGRTGGRGASGAVVA